jgi:hypothetical protein
VAGWRVVVSPIIDFAGDDSNQLTAEINRTLEDQIRLQPADWLWTHNRWKVPRPHFLFDYHSRGVAFPKGYNRSLRPFRILVIAPADPVSAEVSLKAVAAIKHGRPDAEVTVAASESLAALFRAIPEIDAVIVRNSGESIRSFSRKISGGFSVCFLFSTEPRDAVAAFLARIPRRVGAASRGPGRFFINQAILVSKNPERFLQIAHGVGANSDANPGQSHR